MEKKQLTVFCGALIKDKKILMTKRNEEECEDAHMKWEFPGGKAKFGETPEEAVVREMREETGYDVLIHKLLPITLTNYWEYAWGIQQTFCFLYLCGYVNKQRRKSDHHIAEVKWFTLDEAERLESLGGTKKFIKQIREEMKK